MYLSRLLLNPNSQQVRREIAAPYNLHRTILHAFASDRQSVNVLHRLEINSRSGQMMLLIQSDNVPDWHWLVEKEYLIPAEPFSGFANPAVKELDLSLANGRILKFRLTANPTIKKVRRDEDGNRLNSNRVPLVHEKKQIEWLEKRADVSGFHLLRREDENGDLVPFVSISDERKQASRKKRITVYSVQFNGRLRITDTTAFTSALRQGIGPAKAFGCGLLSLAPPNADRRSLSRLRRSKPHLNNQISH